MPIYSIRADVKLNGSIMEVEADTPEEAERIATERPNFDHSFAELADWHVTKVEKFED